MPGREIGITLPDKFADAVIKSPETRPGSPDLAASYAAPAAIDSDSHLDGAARAAAQISESHVEPDPPELDDPDQGQPPEQRATSQQTLDPMEDSGRQTESNGAASLQREVQPDARHYPVLARPSYLSQRHPLTDEPIIRTGQVQKRGRQNEFRLEPDEQGNSRAVTHNPSGVSPIRQARPTELHAEADPAAIAAQSGTFQDATVSVQTAQSAAERVVASEVSGARIDTQQTPTQVGYYSIPSFSQRTKKQGQRPKSEASRGPNPVPESRADLDEQQAARDWAEEQAERIGRIWLRRFPGGRDW